MPANRYITTGEAARELGVSASTLTRLAAARAIEPAERTPGGHYRWHLTTLRRQLAAYRDPEADTTAEDIASVVHDASRRYQIITGDPAPSPIWDEAPQRQVDGAIATVRDALASPDMTAEQCHALWMSALTAAGWRYGPVKDEHAKTHPCLVGWADLPEDQRRKDQLLLAITSALRPRP